MVTISKDELLSWLEREEYLEQPWDSKIFKQKSSIQTTKKVADNSNEHYTFSTEKIFQPSSLTKNIFKAIPVLLCFIVGYSILGSKRFSTLGIILFIGICTIFLYWTIQQLNKGFTIKIKITANGISVAGNYFQWQEVLETYTVNRPTGKFADTFLIIGVNSGVLNRFNTQDYFNLNELAKAIECYKAKAQNPTPAPSPASTNATPHSP